MPYVCIMTGVICDLHQCSTSFDDVNLMRDEVDTFSPDKMLHYMYAASRQQISALVAFVWRIIILSQIQIYLSQNLP